VRLFCLPFAGGGASAYRDWPANLPAWIEPLPIQLPGRENRLREPAVGDWHELVASLTHASMDEWHFPWAVYGHSFGGLLAYELAQKVAFEGLPNPLAVYVGACKPPDATDRGARGLHRLDDAALVDAVVAMGGTPDGVFDHPEMRALLLPTLRADFKLCETYRPTTRAPIEVPLVVYGGDEDADATPAELDGWRKFARRDFRRRDFAGGHFFLRSHQAELLADLASDLESRLI
jgi:surfactin synthase thioesterase subunit